MIEAVKIKVIADECRRGLENLAHSSGSLFNGFPLGSCGVASELVGRILKEKLGYDGTYICGVGHPSLECHQTHAWYEVGDYIIDITHDQFQGTGLSGWVFKRNAGWHAEFMELELRKGYCMPIGWPSYPFDGYYAILNHIQP